MPGDVMGCSRYVETGGDQGVLVAGVTRLWGAISAICRHQIPQGPIGALA
jgi:hypothetical protein